MDSPEHVWRDIDRGKPKYSETELSQAHFVCQKFHMDCRKREPGVFEVRHRVLTA